MSLSTEKVKADPRALEREHTRQRRWSMGKKIGRLAVAAAIGLAAVALVLGALEGQGATTPADEPPTEAPRTSPQPGVALIDRDFVDSINECQHLLATEQEVNSALGFRAEDPAPWKKRTGSPWSTAAQVESWGGVTFGCEYASPGYLRAQRGVMDKDRGSQVVISAYPADAPPIPWDRSEPVRGIGDEAVFTPFGNGDGHMVGPEGATSMLQVRSGNLILRFNGEVFDPGLEKRYPHRIPAELPALRQLAEVALAKLQGGALAHGATTSGPFFLDLRTGERTSPAQNRAGGLNHEASPDGTRLASGTSRRASILPGESRRWRPPRPRHPSRPGRERGHVE